ncbi:MAG: argininosuccinate lyase [Chloroflexi bacterium]|nr:argininosuccinate lyase [Chloroflexota bacterium]
MSTLWGGRFQEPADDLFWRFHASIGFDIRLAQVDIRGSQAYARALQSAGVLTAEEAQQIQTGLEQVAAEFAANTFTLATSDEDIHTAVERRLHELIGPVAGKLHTGRSRNDQIATDVRLWLMEELPALAALLRALQQALAARAEDEIDVLMPGYTHLQPAQPLRFSHWMLAYFWMLQRDRERLQDALPRVRECPLGAGALAGNAYGIDREALAKDLGFEGVTHNSIESVADRDYILEVLAWAAILGGHLSRLAEDLVLWSSSEFGFVRLAERYTTGSSIMPQKRNPDSLELVRGKAGRLTGNLVTLLTVTKGLPMSYDTDLQEDKEPLFDSLDTLAQVLPVVTGVVATLQVVPERMRAALNEGLLATDLADYLTRRGLPFRQAHHAVGQAVLKSEQLGVPLSQIPLEEYQAISPCFGLDLYTVLDYQASVEARNSLGGTSRAAVLEQLRAARRVLESDTGDDLPA